jgi:hypothetical protein
MVKHQAKTRKARTTSRSKAKVHTSILTIPQLRKAFDHMDSVVEHLRKTSKHSFSDAVAQYREEWRKTFKRDISPADAAAYLKFRFGIKGATRSTRRSRMRGGAAALAGAPLDYSTRPGVTGVYGNFPTYQSSGLDRFYGNAITAQSGKHTSHPLDESAASQKGGGNLTALFRPFVPGATPSSAYINQQEFKGVPSYPTADPTGRISPSTPGVSGLTPFQVSKDITSTP